ncbi:MAG: efflux RND transporter periplasmic adaptor subunit [Vitreoscilla sp.]|nr:efflux RND transporter periplasmic adaptor subunit [Vitreoscilla sp.]
MQRRWMFGGVAVLALVAGGGFWAVSQKTSAKAHDSKDGKEAAEAALQFSPSEVARAQMRVLPRVVELSGPLVAPNTAVVRAKASGTLVTLNVAEGSRVRKGEALGTLDLADLNARLAERQAMAESARAQLAQADRSHQSNLHLAEQQFISPVALETSKAALGSAKAQLNAAQAQVDTVRVALREAALMAPIGGIVAKRQALPGEKVSAEQPIVTLVDLTKLELAATVGTQEVGHLRPGLPVQVMVEGDAKPVAGRIARIAPAVEAGSRAIGVTVELANPNERLRAGQFAMARVNLPETPPSLTVPSTAVGSASGQDYVWTLEQGKLLRRSITTGRRDATNGVTEVLQGIAADTLVLAASFDNLREGRAASVGDKPAAAGAASAPASAAVASR